MVPALLLAAGLLAEAAPAASPVAPAAATRPPAAAKPAKDALICHSEPEPGSRLVHRVCMTREELDQRRLADRAAIERMQRQGRMPRRRAA